MNVLWNSNFILNDGYSVSDRENLRALYDVGLRSVRLLPPKIGGLDVRGIDPEYEPVLSFLTTEMRQPDVNVVHHSPYLLRRFNLRPPSVAMTVWETTGLHWEAVEILNRYTQIWVPSTFCQNVFKESGVKPPVHVVPHCYSPTWLEGEKDPNRKDFVFYFIGTWMERKRPWFLLEAFLKEFSGDENVRLIIKTGVVGIGPDPSMKVTLDRLIEKVKNEKGSNPLPQYDIVMDDTWTSEKIKKLHFIGDCFVTACHGEGFGLDALQACVTGNRVISVAWGGSTDFLNPQDDILLPYYLRNVRNMDWSQHYSQDQEWADFEVNELQRGMRKAFEAGRKVIKRDLNAFSRKAVGERMVELLKGLVKTSTE